MEKAIGAVCRMKPTSCLLYTSIISIVYKADGKKDLYSFMNEILSGFAN